VVCPLFLIEDHVKKAVNTKKEKLRAKYGQLATLKDEK
jgi:hypothetical protein